MIGKKTLLRCTISCGLLALSMTVDPLPAFAQQRAYSIVDMSLSRALREYGRVTGSQIIFTEDLVRNRRAPALVGTFAPEEALSRLLDGSGLRAERTPAGAIMIVRAGAGDVAATDLRGEMGGPADLSEGENSEIVITGTNIRGIAPESSPAIVIDRDYIERSGQQSTEFLLRTVPQVFGGGANSLSPRSIPNDIESSSNFSGGAGVNLRGLGASSTLTLLNGRRLAPAGSDGSFVDISSIPVSAIDRIEILTDGASSVYGADAVAGVVNFLLRTDYEGFESSVEYGTVTQGGLDQVRLSQTAGTRWSTGNALLSYEYFQRDALYGREREFSAAAPDPLTLLPRESRHSLFGYITNRLDPDLRVSITGYYAARDSFRVFNRFRLDRGQQIYTSNPESFFISPSFQWDISPGWNITVSGDYSSVNENTVQENYFQDNLGQAERFEFRTDSYQYSADAVASGRLVRLPGGWLRTALGASRRWERFDLTGALTSQAQRTVSAVFGELFIPVFGAANSAPGLRRLEFNISARLDDYSDFGSSINPKFAALWSPFTGLRIRGSYGTSFNPPDLGIIGEPGGGVNALPGANPAAGGPTIPFLVLANTAIPNLGPERSRSYTFGAEYEAALGPHRLSFSVGYYNIRYRDRIGSVPTPSGLASLLDVPAFRSLYPSEIFTERPSETAVRGVIQDVVDRGGRYTDVIGLFTGTPADLSNIDFIIDLRTRNLARVNIEGIDLNANADFHIVHGTISAFANASHIIDYTARASELSPEIPSFNRIFLPVDLRIRGGISWRNGGFGAGATINFTDSYRDDRVGFEGKVDSWTTVDLNLSYQFAAQGRSVLNNTRFAVSVINLLDQSPPFVASDGLTATGSGFSVSYFDAANADPMGRFVSFRLTKAW